MKNILVVIGFLVITVFNTNAQDRAKAFRDSLYKALDARMKAKTKLIKRHKGFELTHVGDDYYFNKPDLLNKYMGRRIFSGEPSYPWRKMSLKISNEDLLYSYLKPFTKWIKLGQEYSNQNQPEGNVHTWPFQVGFEVIADTDGNIITIAMSFHESMPIPYEECLAFYNRMTNGKLKVNIIKGNEYMFKKAKWLTYDFKIDLRNPELLKKLEEAQWRE